MRVLGITKRMCVLYEVKSIKRKVQFVDKKSLSAQYFKLEHIYKEEKNRTREYGVKCGLMSVWNRVREIARE